MHDGILIEEVDGGHETLLEFLLGGDADVAQDGAGELGEEALDQIEPGTVLGREGESEPVGRLLDKPSPGLPGDVRGMIVEDQMDRRVDAGLTPVHAYGSLDDQDRLMTISLGTRAPLPLAPFMIDHKPKLGNVAGRSRRRQGRNLRCSSLLQPHDAVHWKAMLITPDPKLWRDWAAKARALSRVIEDATMRKCLEEIAERYDILAEITSRHSQSDGHSTAAEEEAQEEEG
jgi:hypothetical protein